MAAAAAGFRQTTLEARPETNAAGEYVICGLPPDTGFAIDVLRGSRVVARDSIRAGAERVLRLDLSFRVPR